MRGDIVTETLDTLYRRYARFDPALLADPYPLLRRLRTECPVYRSGSRYVLTRHDDVAAVLRDPRFSVKRPTRVRHADPAHVGPTGVRMRAMMAFRGRQMLESDPPDHTRLRALANHAFAARTIAAMRPRIQRLVDDLLDQAATRGEMDVIAALAYPLPVIVIAELLGVPPEDRDRIRRWSAGAIPFLDGFRNPIAAEAAWQGFGDYLRAIIADRRVAPRDDLLTAFLHAEEGGSRLDEDELLAMCILLLIAGHETTTNLIGNGLLTLLRHPDQLALVRDDPARLASAVEEVLRYESPVQIAARVATEDCTIAGVPIAAGTPLTLHLGAANRDPDRFSDPDCFNIARAEGRHLAFGQGAHYCLGAVLARMEGEIALGTTLRRLPELRLASTAVEWRRNLTWRGPVALPVAFG
jgi:cytochrome P450